MDSSHAMSVALAGHADIRLGWDPMDAMHEEFDLLARALLGAAPEDIPGAFEAVEIHLGRHFRDEERWMAESGFPAMACHAEEHASVLATLSAIRQKVAAGETEAARVFARALLDWFPPHSQHLDSAVAHWLCVQRLGGKPVVVRRTRATDPAVTVPQS